MKFLSRLFAVCLSFLFAGPFVSCEKKMEKVGESDTMHETLDTPTQVNSMESICVRVLLKEGSVEAVRDWFRTLMDRRRKPLSL